MRRASNGYACVGMRGRRAGWPLRRIGERGAFLVKIHIDVVLQIQSKIYATQQMPGDRSQRVGRFK